MELSVGSVFSKIEHERGSIARIHTAFSEFPQGMLAHYEFYKSIMLADRLPLPRQEREYLAYRVSQHNACPYCVAHHQQALDSHSATPLKENRQVVLDQLALAMALKPWVAHIQRDSFMSAGFTEAQWQHAVMVCSYFCLANRCALAMNLELEDDYSRSCR